MVDGPKGAPRGDSMEPILADGDAVVPFLRFIVRRTETTIEWIGLLSVCLSLAVSKGRLLTNIATSPLYAAHTGKVTYKFETKGIEKSFFLVYSRRCRYICTCTD